MVDVCKYCGHAVEHDGMTYCGKACQALSDAQHKFVQSIENRIKDSVGSTQSIIQERWERGIPHNPLSIIIVHALEAVDFRFFNDYFGIKVGGDGDNGETMMYIFDAYIEELGGLDDLRGVVNYLDKTNYK